MLRCTELKIAAANVNIPIVEIKSGKLMLTRNHDYILIGGKFPRLSDESPEAMIQHAVELVKKF